MHEWVYNNVSISLKNPLLCLSVNVPECQTTIIFMQYKITWLVTVEYVYAGLWEYVLIVKV